MSRPFFDRTSEFRSAVESAAFRISSAAPASQQLLPPESSRNKSAGAGGQGQTGQRSEFARMAAKIGKDIQGTTGKLEKLAQLAKRKTLFDDRPVEISELTYIIKQDIAALNQQIAQLQAFTQSNLNAGAGSKQVSEHNKNVVTMLQTKLADTTIGFKDVLEIRTQNMKASRDRTEQFTFSGAANPRAAPPSVLRARTTPSNPSRSPYELPAPASGTTSSHPYAATYTDSPLYRPQTSNAVAGGDKGKGKAAANAAGGDFLALDFGAPTDSQLGAAEGGYMQMELAQQQGDDQYLSSRSTAIETIESTVAELGQIFSQLAHMVAVQGEQVTRIDADTEDIAANVTGAQSELLRYYASVSSNRWLMLKVFGVLIIFFLVFVLVS
ncbi:t-SNARE syntaxin [Sporobolomyces koalae]|uniref:t-SNARE syntaxin n=1 Tax=Sporobolomyces koalae TaxID=500713 RepID=UPI003170250C